MRIQESPEKNSGKGGVKAKQVKPLQKPLEDLKPQTEQAGAVKPDKSLGKGVGSKDESNSVDQKDGENLAPPQPSQTEKGSDHWDWTDNWWNHNSGYWYGQRDWSWGLGSKHDWATWEAASTGSWRTRAESNESFDVPPEQALAPVAPTTPSERINRKASSLDSDMMVALQRLTTMEKEAQNPQNLAPKFDEAKTPLKEAQVSPSSTSPGPSPATSTTPSTSLEKPETTEKLEGTNKDAGKGPAEEKGQEGDKNDKSKEKLEELKKKKLAAHARYMRYFRSVHGRDLN